MTLLNKIASILYTVSLHTEEGASVRCHVVYLDPSNPDPSPPNRIVRDRWTVVPFVCPIQYSVANIVKLARASDPRTSSLAIYKQSSTALRIWGLIDQGNSWHQFAHHNTDGGMERPGIIQFNIEGIGHLVAYRGFEKVAEIKQDQIRTSSIDPLLRGTLSDRLLGQLDEVEQRVVALLPARTRTHPRARDSNWVYHDYILSLKRILLRVQSFSHGGSLIIVPPNYTSATQLAIKYTVNYPRLLPALERMRASTIASYAASDIINHMVDDDDIETIPVNLHYDVICHDIDRQESDDELDGSIWFVASLSRVDGAVVMTHDLKVIGFGAEITCNEEPTSVRLAKTAKFKRSRSSPLNYHHFGTRHRSMMRYCNMVPGSVGFVISQDGVVRAMTKINKDIVVWDSIRLTLFWSPKSKRR